MPRILQRFQSQLESIHGISVPAHVEDYLIGPPQMVALGNPVRAPEELLVLEDRTGLSLGLYIDPLILAELGRRHPPLTLLLGKLLPSYCAAAEGVSHWLYLSHRAGEDHGVSMLELEVQAEVDKFASCALELWRLGLKNLAKRLCERLYEGVRYFAHLDADERDRYATANRLARGYARFLERRFVSTGDHDGLLRELRRSFRLSGGEKYAYLASAA